MTPKQFAEWEIETFGYGYGTGEEPVLAALKRFMEIVPQSGAYDYCTLQEQLPHAVVWLLINTLCHAGMIEYGCSPRFGWLTSTGAELREFVLANTVDQLCGYTH